MIKKSMAILLLAAGLFGAPALATDNVRFDGVWWQALSSHDQVIALEGMLAGIGSHKCGLVRRGF